jgi:hypothetical protein
MSRQIKDPISGSWCTVAGAGGAIDNFTGTLAEWEALSPIQQAQYNSLDILDDYNGMPIDDELSDTSIHPVQNKVVTASIEELTDDVEYIMNSASYSGAISSLIGGSFTHTPSVKRLGDIVIISGVLSGVDFVPNTSTDIFQITSGNRPKEESRIYCGMLEKDTGALRNSLLTIKINGKAILNVSNVTHIKEVMFYGAYIAETPS